MPLHVPYVAATAGLPLQAMSLGLGKEWDRICKAYAAANRALGDIVKVRAGCS